MARNCELFFYAHWYPYKYMMCHLNDKNTLTYMKTILHYSPFVLPVITTKFRCNKYNLSRTYPCPLPS